MDSSNFYGQPQIDPTFQDKDQGGDSLTRSDEQSLAQKIVGDSAAPGGAGEDEEAGAGTGRGRGPRGTRNKRRRTSRTSANGSGSGAVSGHGDVGGDNDVGDVAGTDAVDSVDTKGLGGPSTSHGGDTSADEITRRAIASLSESHHHDALMAAATGGDLDDESRLSRQGRPLSQSKRAQQNRAAQRAFRQRKEKYIKELEQRVRDLETANETVEQLRRENQELRDYILRLQTDYINDQDIPQSLYSGGSRGRRSGAAATVTNAGSAESPRNDKSAE